MTKLLSLLTPSTIHAAADDIVGVVTPPAGLANTVQETGSFISIAIVLIVIVAGLFTLWQLLSGGFDYITSSGDKTKIEQATHKITMAIVGIVIVAASFIIIAIAGAVFFGNPGAFLSPMLKTL